MENDLISRAALMGVPNVRKVCEYDETGCSITYKAVPVEVIEEAPSVKAEPKWISVKDEMPPTGNAVLVVVHSKNMNWVCVEIDIWDGAWIENADSDWHIVTHWMPLPEPPKEEHHAD